MPHQHRQVISLRTSIKDILQLVNLDLPEALLKMDEVTQQFLFISALDSFYSTLKKHAPQRVSSL